MLIVRTGFPCAVLGAMRVCPWITIDQWRVVGANCVRPQLSEYGNIVDREIKVLSETYDAVQVIKHIVMPNHIHMMVLLKSDGRTQFAPTISRIIKQFKGSISKKIGFQYGNAHITIKLFVTIPSFSVYGSTLTTTRLFGMKTFIS